MKLNKSTKEQPKPIEFPPFLTENDILKYRRNLNLFFRVGNFLIIIGAFSFWNPPINFFQYFICVFIIFLSESAARDLIVKSIIHHKVLYWRLALIKAITRNIDDIWNNYKNAETVAAYLEQRRVLEKYLFFD